ncbi:MAG: hypothetical protein JW974_03700 [Alphaproteobacteria bacterium]|nr:hypothetical protein [Alphaproteobacteria bacterium]MBN2675341.1 hypothetical protein [Alphaproteobacteria bacterium]
MFLRVINSTETYDETNNMFSISCNKCLKNALCQQTENTCSIIKLIQSSLGNKIIGTHIHFYNNKVFFYAEPKTNKDFQTFRTTFKSINTEFRKFIYNVQNVK